MKQHSAYEPLTYPLEGVGENLGSVLDGLKPAQQVDLLRYLYRSSRIAELNHASTIADQSAVIDSRERTIEQLREENATLFPAAVRAGRLENTIIDLEADNADLLDEITRLAHLEDKLEVTQTDLEIALGVANQQNARIKELEITASIDQKTGLPLAGTFWDLVEADLEQQKRDTAKNGKGEVENAVLILDIDDFKAINDALLYTGADKEALIPMAKRLMASIRVGDFICRWGGEEIGVYLKNVTPNEAKSIATSLRSTVNELKLSETVAGKDFVGASVGVASLWSKGDAQEAFVRANFAVFTAKRIAGKNQVMHFDEIDLQDPNIRRYIAKARDQTAQIRSEHPSTRRAT